MGCQRIRAECGCPKFSGYKECFASVLAGCFVVGESKALPYPVKPIEISPSPERFSCCPEVLHLLSLNFGHKAKKENMSRKNNIWSP